MRENDIYIYTICTVSIYNNTNTYWIFSNTEVDSVESFRLVCIHFVVITKRLAVWEYHCAWLYVYHAKKDDMLMHTQANYVRQVVNSIVCWPNQKGESKSLIVVVLSCSVHAIFVLY